MATPSELRQRAMDLEGEADALEDEQASAATEAEEKRKKLRDAFHAYLRQAYEGEWDKTDTSLALERAFERLEPTP